MFPMTFCVINFENDRFAQEALCEQNVLKK